MRSRSWGGARMTALAQSGTWHARLLAIPGPGRRRLPSDVVRALSWAVGLAGPGAQVVAAGLVPAGALAAAGLGTLTGALMQLAFGTPYGSVAQVNVVDLAGQLGVTARDVGPAPYAPTWGVARFTAVDGVDGVDGVGRPLDID